MLDNRASAWETEVMDGERNDSEKKVRSWKQDPKAVRADILRAAKAEFAENGLAGARIQDIANRIQTSKRMIFYYFGDKEGLYRAALEDAYRSVRKGEAELDLNGLPPTEALRRLVRFTFDHHRNNADFIRLVMIENIHDGRHMRAMETLSESSTTAIEQLARICEAGIGTGEFRKDVSPLVLHWQISAMCFFNVSNRPTFSIIFGEELFTDKAQGDLREQVVHAVLTSVLA
ncbi:TetR/AcrR family transcriptional regulator [Tropicimonas marinistellae]|uniref:TetR/AcrR family transcriptional regulator n=1 Tax=Tropicimonas marinistellae TaxID=1739787 RepID=UPI000B2F0910|nr:TetR/AcrR family transcriptional regulator [Tropicimonas marinistellae]